MDLQTLSGTDTNIRNNPFWNDEVKQFAVVKFEQNQKNKDLYFWIIKKQYLEEGIDMDDDDVGIKEGKLKDSDRKILLPHEILVRVVGSDFKDTGTMRKYVGGALFYRFQDKKWKMAARLNVLKYSQDSRKADRRFRLTKPVDKIGMFDEVVGESPWDKPSSDFKPGLLAYHEESERGHREYAGMLGTILLYAESRIIQNEGIRYPVTYLNSLVEISFDLLNAKAKGTQVSVLYAPR